MGTSVQTAHLTERGRFARTPRSGSELLDPLGREHGLRGRRGEECHERYRAAAIGRRLRRRGGIARVVLRVGRQRPDQLKPLVAVKRDLGKGAEPDLLALALDDVLEYGGAVGIARFLGLGVGAGAKLLEQLFEI